MPDGLCIELPRSPEAPGQARAALRGVDALGPRLPEVQLLVSELVTNSVKYGGDGPVELHVDTSGDRIRAEIVDTGGGFVPVARDRALDDPGGWGLHLVEELTDRWGAYEGSTHVWFEMSRDGDG